MQEALIYAVAAVTPLVFGAFLSTRIRISKRVLAVILAFASGSLLSALAYDLFGESFRTGGALAASAGLLIGAIFYILLNSWLTRQAHQAKKEGRNSLSLLATAAFDGIPENLVLGITLATGKPSLALLVAIMVANFPEAFGGAESMRQHKYSNHFIMRTWIGVAVITAIPVLLGHSLLADIGTQQLSLVLAFAAGGLLAAVADTLMPEAYDEGGSWVAFATAAGFLLSFLLNEL